MEDVVEFFNRAWQAYQENDSFQMASSVTVFPIKLTYNWGGEVDLDFQLGTTIGVYPIELKRRGEHDPSDNFLPPGTLSTDLLMKVPGAVASIDEERNLAFGVEHPAGLPVVYTLSPEAVGNVIQAVAKPAAENYQKFVRFNMGKGWDDSSP